MRSRLCLFLRNRADRSLPGCRGIDSSSKEAAGLKAEKDGLQKKLAALQAMHAEGLTSSQAEADGLRKVRHPPSGYLLLHTPSSTMGPGLPESEPPNTLPTNELLETVKFLRRSKIYLLQVSAVVMGKEQIKVR